MVFRLAAKRTVRAQRRVRWRDATLEMRLGDLSHWRGCHPVELWNHVAPIALSGKFAVGARHDHSGQRGPGREETAPSTRRV